MFLFVCVCVCIYHLCMYVNTCIVYIYTRMHVSVSMTYICIYANIDVYVYAQKLQQWKLVQVLTVGLWPNLHRTKYGLWRDQVEWAEVRCISGQLCLNTAFQTTYYFNYHKWYSSSLVTLNDTPNPLNLPSTNPRLMNISCPDNLFTCISEIKFVFGMLLLALTPKRDRLLLSLSCLR